MVIEMVACDVGEHGHPKVDIVDPMKGQRVRRHLDYRVDTIGAPHQIQQPLQQQLLQLVSKLISCGKIIVCSTIAIVGKSSCKISCICFPQGILSVIFLPLQKVENFISYTCGLYVYIPGGVGTLLVLDKISRWFIEGDNDAPKWWIYLVGFLAGWSHEVYGFFMIPLVILLVVWRIVIEKEPFASIPSWVWYLIGSFTLGFGVLVLAPGTQSRALMQPAYSLFTLLISSLISCLLSLLIVSFKALAKSSPVCRGPPRQRPSNGLR